MELFVPENLEIDSLIPDNMVGDERDRLHDRIVYLCHTLVTALRSKKVFDRFIETGYIQLMMVYLRNVLGKHTEPVIKLLEDRGVIHIDRNFIVRVKSRGYALDDKFQKTGLKKVPLRSYQARKMVKKVEWQYQEEQKKQKARISYTINALTSNPWTIDIKGAGEWIDRFKKEMGIGIRSSAIIPQDQKEHLVTQYHHYLDFIRVQVQQIHAGYWNESIHERNGRLHTNLTSLPRPLKHFIFLEGAAPLMSLDIKNSQPFLMGYLTQKSFWSTNSYEDKDRIKLMALNKELHSKTVQSKEERSAIIKMVESAEMQSGGEVDAINFLSLVQEGRFYEFLMDQFKGRFRSKGQDRFATRELAKTEVLRLMYFDTRKAGVPFYAPFKEFEQLFPIEARIMRFLKTWDYKDFPVLLQQMESKLILHHLGSAIRRIPFLTIHDSVIFPENHKTDVEKAIEKVFAEKVGAIPRLGEATLAPESAYNELPIYVWEKVQKLELKYTVGLPITTSGIAEEDDDMED